MNTTDTHSEEAANGKPTVFFEDHLSNESDAWPQMVFSGDYYSDYLERVMPGQWTYFSGDRNSNDGCEVYETGIRGARNVLDALETVDSLSYFDNAERAELISRATELKATETLIRHAWDLYEQEPNGPYADSLRTAVWELEEAVDHGSDALPRLGREVVQALTLATGDEVDELLAPMPGVATWLGL